MIIYTYSMCQPNDTIELQKQTQVTKEKKDTE